MPIAFSLNSRFDLGDLLGNISFGWLYYALVAVYAVTVVSIIVVILSENRSPVKSLAWVTVLMLLPAMGIVLYLFFGRSIKNTRMISRRNRRRLRKFEEAGRRFNVRRFGVSAASEQLIKLTNALAGSPSYPDNDIEIFTDGEKKFDRLFDDISRASSYINIQYYIIEDDSLGVRLKDLLIRKAKEGLKVRLIYDNVGSFRTKNSYFKELRESGVEAYPFFKVVFPPFGTRINWRNHRKIVIIDGEIGYIGGMNVANRYISGAPKFKSWRDTHIRVAGPAVASLQFAFAVDWNFMGQPLIYDRPIEPSAITSDGAGCVAQLLTSGPTSQWTNIAFLFSKAIASAKKRVYLQTPYFLPTEGLLKVLQAAALAGVDVRIMIPKRSDSRMLDAASASYITQCMQSGIKFYLYLPGMLHAKVLIVDDEFVSVGSTNFDFRSFEHNFEANMQVYSKSFNAQMTAIFLDDIKSSQRINPQEWKSRPVTEKALESLTRLFSPIL